MKLGAYKADSYYDPQRPSWLPNWLDTPSENFLKWGFYPDVTTLQPTPPPPGVQPPGAPNTQDQLRGHWSIDQSIAAGHNNSLAKWDEFFTGLSDEEESRQRERDSNVWLWLLGAGVAASVVLIVLARR